MKLEDLYLINKEEEWLDVIKDKCKKKAITNFWVGLVCLIILIILTVAITVALSTPHSTHDKEGFGLVYLLALFLWALTSGWWVLKSYSFLKTVDGLGTPEQLLIQFKKYIKDKSIIWTIAQLIFNGWFACFVFFSDLDIIMKVMLWIFIFAFAIVYIYRLKRGKYILGINDEDITRRLQELIGEE